MLQTREPIPKYSLLNPVSFLRTWHFKHGVYATNFTSPDLLFCNGVYKLWKMVGLKYNTKTCQ